MEVQESTVAAVLSSRNWLEVERVIYTRFVVLFMYRKESTQIIYSSTKLMFLESSMNSGSVLIQMFTIV